MPFYCQYYMDNNEFRLQAHKLVDWMADYLENVSRYPVKSQVSPGDILKMLPSKAPAEGESMADIFSDFEKIIMPGITHWQSPKFFAYFPANASYPSLLGEMLTATLGAQCMKWETSPAAAELEEQVLEWLRKMIGLPEGFTGVIQDSASSATLASIITARERKGNFRINAEGYAGNKYRVYCSSEAHSSIEKAVRIAGLGSNNLVKIAVDEDFRMIPAELDKQMTFDLEQGYIPLCVVAALGTTGSTAVDPLAGIGSICKKHNAWLHVDAAFAGSALILPEYRWMIEGIDLVDSFVFNPHKWLFTHFDCSAYYVRDRQSLVNTFSILPEYLRTNTQGKVNDYCDWGVQLGRRFRALKLWFVLRNFGVNALQEKLRNHIRLAGEFRDWLLQDERFELLAPLTFNVICFRLKPGNLSLEESNRKNEELLHRINSTGKMYITHTKLAGRYTLRMVIGQTNVEHKHIEEAFGLLLQLAPY